MTKLRELAESFANKTPIGIYSPDDIIQIAYEAGFRAAREFLYASPKYVQCRKENDTLRRQLEIAVGALSNISENPSCACDRILEAKAEHALAQIEAIGKRESS